MSLSEIILDYWFGDIRFGLSPQEKNKLWYGGGEAIDTEIRLLFGEPLAQFKSDDYPDWVNSPRGILAAVILTDQFSRNIYRGQAKAFSFDHIALKLCLQGVEKGLDKELKLVERVFFYHPLEHSEVLSHQELCVEQFSLLIQETNLEKGISEEIKEQRVNFVSNGLNYAKLHRDIIAQFGRFPHRNDILNRQATDAETNWLQDGGNRFGQ